MTIRTMPAIRRPGLRPMARAAALCSLRLAEGVAARCVVLMGVCATLLLACGSADDDGPDAPQQPLQPADYRISFTIHTADTPPSRAAETDEPGTGRENYIDLAQSTFLLFTNTASGDGGADTYLATLEPESVTPVDGSAYPDTWTVVATISGPDGTPLTLEKLAEGYKVVMFANCSLSGVTLTDATTLSGLCDAVVYDYTSISSLDQLTIPMYGVLPVASNVNYQTFISNWIGTLYLIRAMAKVEIISKDIELSSVAVNTKRWNGSGYAAPTGYYADTHTWTTAAESVETRATHIPTTVATGTETLPFILADDRHSAVVYVPEFSITNDNSGMTLTITLLYQSTEKPSGSNYTTEKVDGTTVYTIEKVFSDFRVGEYVDGVWNNKWFNILRNYYYSYEVSYSEEFTINTVNYTVCLWDNKTSCDIHFD